MTPAILIIAFRRERPVRELIDALRVSRPPVLHIFIDGPRPATDDDVRRAAVRNSVLAGVDWPCRLRWLDQRENLGCGRGPTTAISWFLDDVGEGAILEDDCVPGPEFLPFTAHCLARYRDDATISQVSGNCFVDPRRSRASYWFSRYPHNWGWATWNRSWTGQDAPLADWSPGEVPAWLRDWCPLPGEARAWARAFDEFVTNDRARDVWDTAWQYHCWRRSRLAVTPAANLVTNVGFSDDATHTLDGSPFARYPISPLGPLVDPAGRRADSREDARTWDGFYRYVLSCPKPPPPWKRLRMTLGRWRHDLFSPHAPQ